jgi:hypothetical protein
MKYLNTVVEFKIGTLDYDLDTKVVRNSGIESHPGITLITPIETVSKNRVDEILEKISLLGMDHY